MLMQKRHVLSWAIAGCLFFLPQLTTAQNVFNSPATVKNQGTLPSPTTISNEAFGAKVKTQADRSRNELKQEAQQQAADAMASSKQKMPPAETNTTMPTQDTDTGATNTSPTQETAAPANNTNNTYNPPTTPYVAPSNTANQTPAPANNTRSNNGQGGWQIQY